MQNPRTLVLSVSISLFLSLFASRTVPAEPANDAAAVARGQTFVEKTCVGCHAGAQLDVVVGRRLEAREVVPLDGFLATHHVPDKAIRAEVIAYLKHRLAKSAGSPQSR